MATRRFDLADRLIGGIDNIIKVLTVPARPRRDIPDAAPATTLAPAERESSVRLMRGNHSGEAAAEEVDHLAWCEQRLKELQGRTSVLNPLWYLGSFALGAFAGTLGDRNSLGFIAESEKQVESHLRDHLE